MDASKVAEAIPFTAWEQAVFVGLFIVLVVALLAWFSKENAKTQKFQDGQNVSWQKFLKDQNDQWQRWIERYNTEHVVAMKSVADALEKLGEKLDAHDEKVDMRIDAAASGRKTTRPRGG